MSYQALLFCPDEKTARTVTQVLGELDFNVTACTEPFAAVKKFMGERFDAVVVDCENEQNATLLFKSARSAPNNQGALAVAIVEGQAGVAKAFRIGANLVLTKPINVEQTKGTLRVARGLLRKNEAAKPASSIVGATPAKPLTAPQPQTQKPAETRMIPPPVHVAPANVIPMSRPTAQPNMVASPAVETGERIPEPALSGKPLHDGESSSPSSSSSPAFSATTTEAPFAPKVDPASQDHPQSNFSSGLAASAPAPACETKENVPAESAKVFEPADQEIKTDSKDHAASPAKMSASTHTLTFGGTVGSGSKAKSSGGKNAMIGAVAAVLIAAGGYAAWMKWNPSKSPAATPASVPTRPTPTPPPVAAAPIASAPVPQSTTQPAAETQATDVQTPSPQGIETQKTENQKPSKSTKGERHSAKETSAGNESNEDAPVAENSLPASVPAPQPIVIKSDNGKPAPKPVENADAPALSMTGITTSGEPLPTLGPATSATPVLQRMVVSQGVSRGLLIKEVPPVYPPAALAMRIEGSVQLMATIAKTGDISEVKAVSGEKELAHAAVEAVKQWKYKPYLLNGEPVEIQTQITVNFKLPQ